MAQRGPESPSLTAQQLVFLLDVHPGRGAQYFKRAFGHTNFLRLYSGDESLIDDLARFNRDLDGNPFRGALENMRAAGELPQPSKAAKRVVEELAGPPPKSQRLIELEAELVLARAETAVIREREEGLMMIEVRRKTAAEAKNIELHNESMEIRMNLDRLTADEAAKAIKDNRVEQKLRQMKVTDRIWYSSGFHPRQMGLARHNARTEAIEGSLLGPAAVPNPTEVTAASLPAPDPKQGTLDSWLRPDVAPVM